MKTFFSKFTLGKNQKNKQITDSGDLNWADDDIEIVYPDLMSTSANKLNISKRMWC